MISGAGITCWVALQFRTRRKRYRVATSVSVLDNRDGLDGSVCCEKLLRCGCDIKVPDKNVGHELILRMNRSETCADRLLFKGEACS